MITDSQSIRAALLARLRNAEALLVHYGQWSAEHLAGECASTPELGAMEAVLRRLRDLRAALNDLQPAPAAVLEAPAGSLVTTGSPVPAALLQTP
jgi:hypothetical protein